MAEMDTWFDERLLSCIQSSFCHFTDEACQEAQVEVQKTIHAVKRAHFRKKLCKALIEQPVNMHVLLYAVVHEKVPELWEGVDLTEEFIAALPHLDCMYYVENHGKEISQLLNGVEPIEILKAHFDTLPRRVRNEVKELLPAPTQHELLKSKLEEALLLPIDYEENCEIRDKIVDIEYRCKRRLLRVEMTLCMTHLRVPHDIMSRLLRSIRY
jgi:hypothetical protein